MKILLIALITVLLLTSTTTKQTIVTIIPLGHVSQDVLNKAAESITSFYGYKCVISKEQPLTASLLAGSKTRYEGAKIVRHYNKAPYTLILTEKDIAVSHNGYKEWGVFGVSYCPGNACCVSTFRLKKNVSRAIMLVRFEKICIHEMGHCLGLEHCSSDPSCIMNDAKGTIKQVDRETITFCNKCKNILKHNKK